MMLHKLPIIIEMSTILIFVFLRTYNLSESFFFYNDMGRDMLVLRQWHTTGKPPLLGPQTSALPFNQSAIYFYLLYPGYILSSGNPVANVYTLTVFYVLLFIAGLYLTRHNKPLTTVFVVSFLLLSIHPQYITQGRFVWNPSFVTPAIIISILSFYLLANKYSHKRLIIFALSISTATSISYSVAPLLISMLIFWAIYIRKNIIQLFVGLFPAFLATQLPTILFELRHHFAITKLLLTNKSPVQDELSFLTKLDRLSEYVVATTNHQINVTIFVISIVAALFIVIKLRRTTFLLQYIVSFLYILLTIITFVTPVSVQAHYIFSFTSLIFILIATLPARFMVPILALCLYFYLQTPIVNSYFKRSPRTYSELTTCFKKYCDQFEEPTFVTVQSSFHPYHNGPEHRYLLSKLGCNVQEIEQNRSAAKYMTVVLDNGTFNSNTKYYELELFGNYRVIMEEACQGNLKIVTLEKSDNSRPSITN